MRARHPGFHARSPDLALRRRCRGCARQCASSHHSRASRCVRATCSTPASVSRVDRQRYSSPCTSQITRKTTTPPNTTSVKKCPPATCAARRPRHRRRWRRRRRPPATAAAPPRPAPSSRTRPTARRPRTSSSCCIPRAGPTTAGTVLAAELGDIHRARAAGIVLQDDVDGEPGPERERRDHQHDGAARQQQRPPRQHQLDDERDEGGRDDQRDQPAREVAHDPRRRSRARASGGSRRRRRCRSARGRARDRCANTMPTTAAMARAIRRPVRFIGASASGERADLGRRARELEGEIAARRGRAAARLQAAERLDAAIVLRRAAPPIRKTR